MHTRIYTLGLCRCAAACIHDWQVDGCGSKGTRQQLLCSSANHRTRLPYATQNKHQQTLKLWVVIVRVSDMQQQCRGDSCTTACSTADLPWTLYACSCSCNPGPIVMSRRRPASTALDATLLLSIALHTVLLQPAAVVLLLLLLLGRLLVSCSSRHLDNPRSR